MTSDEEYEPLTHNSVSCINYFVSIFQCILMFLYFRFIRSLNASNCFIITFSFTDFIHGLNFLFNPIPHGRGIPPPPPHPTPPLVFQRCLKWLVWDFKKATINAINLAIKSFNWENAFDGKDINSQMQLFNKILMNIFSNFIFNKIKTFRDSDLKMSNDIKNKFKLKQKLYHC